MKKLLLAFVFGAFALTSHAQQHYVGGDISLLTKYEEHGAKYYTHSGEAISDVLGFFADEKLNAMRVRLFVDPSKAPAAEVGEGVCQDLEYVCALGKRIKSAGMALMLDIHYSDSWADPAKQTVPADWKDYNPDQMADAVARHTRETLQLLKDNHIDVAWVQVGNEVTNGMLWDSGRVSGSNIRNFGTYFAAGYDAVKSVYPQALVVLHIDNGWNASSVQWFFNLMKSYNVAYDVAGFSLYPSYWDNSISGYPDWKTKTQQFVTQVKSFRSLYGKPVLLTEFGMPASQPEETKEALQYLLENTESLDFFGGIFYWEPESEKSRNGYDYGAFSGGKPTAALDTFK